MLTQSVLIACGGFLGALARFTLSRWFAQRGTVFPLGTLSVNLIGSLLLGILFSLRSFFFLHLFIGIGFLGSFTTFSTFKWECLQMAAEKKWQKGVFYLAFSYTAGILFALLGYTLGKSFTN